MDRAALTGAIYVLLPARRCDGLMISLAIAAASTGQFTKSGDVYRRAEVDLFEHDGVSAALGLPADADGARGLTRDSSAGDAAI